MVLDHFHVHDGRAGSISRADAVARAVDPFSEKPAMLITYLLVLLALGAVGHFAGVIL